MKNNGLNKLFLLKLINFSGEVESEAFLQKLVNHTQKTFDAKGIPIFNYSFEEFYFGPYSEDLKSDLEILLEANLVKEENFEKYSVTKLAIDHLATFEEIFRKLEVDTVFKSIIEEDIRGKMHA